MNHQNDKTLREHVLYLLKGGGAHASFEDAIKNFPAELRGKKVKGLPHTAWMLLEHMRIAQWDILDFSINPKYKTMKWPEDYWPASAAPPTPAAWNNSIKELKKDLRAMEDLVANPKADLFQKIPWGEGQTILREALLIADHNAYHVGQLVTLRRLLGAWNE
jgi:DinB family